MTFSNNLRSSTPSEWVVTANDGTTLLANNPSTGETFSGSPATYISRFLNKARDNVLKYKIVTSDATGLDIANGPATLNGVFMIAAGTMAGVYDSKTVSGALVVPSTTSSVALGAGIPCANGITCDWTSGTWLISYTDE